jgi:peptide deformylase
MRRRPWVAPMMGSVRSTHPASPGYRPKTALPYPATAGKKIASPCIEPTPVSTYIAPAMALRDIIILPDKRLRSVSKPVVGIDRVIRTLVDDMFETMYKAPGIGLAAIQVAVPARLVVMDLSKREEKFEPQVFINPEITWKSDEISSYEEGCLSIPDIHEDVERPARVKVRFLDIDGKPQETDADGLFATCIQHEIDHLNGVLFIDHISKLKRDRIIKKFGKAAKREQAEKEE